MSNRNKFILLFFALLLFRILFGLSQPFYSPDELQTYLIGLKWYCHGGWPYFGPDLIVTETGFYTQIPGPLEAWMIGFPLVLCPIPEAPFIFLNLCTTGVLALLAWYISKRLPDIPLFFIFAWIAILPWNLHESTNPINPSYLLIGSTLFFLGFLESIPSLTKKLISPVGSFALMGFGITWDMQFHNSWILLPPFVLLALVLRWRDKQSDLARDIVSFLLGAAPLAALLVPTFLKYGFAQDTAGFQLAKLFNLANFLAFFTILGRFLSLPCFETLRFLGSHTTERMDFLIHHLWILLPGLFMILMGWLQPLSLLVLGCFKDKKHRDTPAISKITLFALLLVWASFWFTSKPPLAHIYYILMPLIVVFSLYIWSRWTSHRTWRLLGIACLIGNSWFEAGYLYAHISDNQSSLYANRAKALNAIRQKDDHLLGERRPGSIY